MNLQVGDSVEHLNHSTAYGPGTVIKIGVEKIVVIWQRKGEIDYYKDGSFTMSGPIVIKLAESINCTTIPNLGKLFTLDCGARILKGTDGPLQEDGTLEPNKPNEPVKIVQTIAVKKENGNQEGTIIDIDGCKIFRSGDSMIILPQNDDL